MDSRFNVKWGKISKGQTHAHKYLRSVLKKKIMWIISYIIIKKTTYVNNNLYFYVKKYLYFIYQLEVFKTIISHFVIFFLKSKFHLCTI